MVEEIQPQLQSAVSTQNLRDMVDESLKNQPETTQLDLQDQEIDDLGVIIDTLSKFEYLEELNLSNNQFTGLPDDLSLLKSITNLNLQNILLDDFEQGCQAIATMPQLRSLHINLQTESQVDLLMRYLPELEYLNGLPVERDAANTVESSVVHEDGGIDDALAAVQQEALNAGNE